VSTSINAQCEAVQIEPVEGWPHDMLKSDFKAGRTVWREVTATFYGEMLDALPPVDFRCGSFLLGEAFSDDVYCGLARAGNRYFARYIERAAFPEAVRTLRAHVLNVQIVD
jgi:hypothetical protein